MARHVPLLGYRSWVVETDPIRLEGVIYKTMWPATGAEATCKAHMYHVGFNHVSPYQHCSCGLHAHYHLHQAARDVDRAGYHGVQFASPLRQRVVLGAVIGWGKIVAHEDGWRAQYARPVALASDYPRAAYLTDVAQEYGIPLVPRDKLERIALEWGEPYAPSQKETQ